jgi:uncharacterized protein YdaU (DUF1376 family)
MNYYEHHIGDYAEATAHLSFVEDAAYSRLIRKYYATEKPIPSDLRAAQRLVAARTREEKEAVARVLDEFFLQSEDGWHHHRCDREIALFQAGEPQREAKKRNEDTRLARHRAERADLFATINDAGLHLPWNAPISEVRALAAHVTAGKTATPATATATPATPQPATPATPTATPPATAPATPATATHSRAPLPTPHSPLPTPQNEIPLTTLTGGSHPPDGGPAELAMHGKALNGHGRNGHAFDPGDGHAADIPDCDHEAVLRLWKELVPNLPQPEKWTKGRAGHLRARWRELFAEGKARTRDEALQWFAKYFRWIAQSRFLTGRAPARPGKPPFEARLDWVLMPDNLAKVIEGEYHREE